MANINPNQPRSDSQRARILAFLLEGNHITSQYALRHFGCARLASRITDIQQKNGYGVKRKKVQVTTADGGTAYVAEYWIDPADLNN
jgi:hypothetical protein